MNRFITRHNLALGLISLLGLGLVGCQSALTFFNRPPPSVAVRPVDSHLPVVRDRCPHHGSDTSDAATGDCPPVGTHQTAQTPRPTVPGLLARKAYVRMASLSLSGAVRPAMSQARPTPTPAAPLVQTPLPEPVAVPATAEIPAIRSSEGVPFQVRAVDARWLTALKDRFTVQLISTTRPETIPVWLQRVGLERQQVHILPSVKDARGRWYYAAVWGDFASPAAARAAVARSLPGLSLSDVWIRPVRGLQHPLCKASAELGIAVDKGLGCPATGALTLS